MPQGNKQIARSSGAELSSIIGQWPGDESDADIFKALRDFS